MADIELLKRLAEAATQGEWERDGSEVGPVWDQNASIAKCSKREDAEFIAAANPAAVLALIAENEENAANLAQWQKAFVRIAGELSVLAAQHGDFTDESTLQQAIDFLKGAMAERDRLKDEMERVRADAERYRAQFDPFGQWDYHDEWLGKDKDFVDSAIDAARGGVK